MAITKEASAPLALNKAALQQDFPGFGSPMVNPFGVAIDSGFPLVGVYGFSFGASGIPWSGYTGFGSIAMNAYGCPLGTFPNYWLMDNNPAVALAQGTANAPLKSAEGSFVVKEGLPKSKADEIVASLKDNIAPLIPQLFGFFCRAPDDGFAAVKHVWGKDAQGIIYPKENQSLNPWLTRAVRDEFGNIIGVSSNGNTWGDTRQFTWVTYDSRYGYPYGRSRKLNFMKPWVNQEYLYDITQLATNVLVRPLPSISVPYTANPNNVPAIKVQNDQTMQNGRTMLNGLMGGQGVIFQNPFANNIEQMIKNGIDPKNAMPYGIDFFKSNTDSGAAIKTLHELFDNGIISGHLVPPRTLMSARQGGKADATQHTDTGTSITECILDDFARCLNGTQDRPGLVSTFIEQNFGEEYIGMVYWQPAPLVDSQLEVTNKIVESVFSGPQGLANMMRVIDMVATFEKVGIKTAAGFDQAKLLADDEKKTMEANKIALAGKGGGDKPDPKGGKMMAMATEDGGEGKWVTIDGAHVHIDKGGSIDKGPKSMVGKKTSELKKSGKPITEHHGSKHPVTKTKVGPEKTTKVGDEKKSSRKPKPSAKSILAKQTSRHVDSAVQRYSEEHNEPILAMMVGGVSLPDGEPADVVIPANAKDLSGWRAAASEYRSTKEAGGKPNAFSVDGKRAHGVELKTMTDNKSGKVFMHQSAIDRKAGFVKENDAHMHTVVFDDQKVFNANGDGKHDDSQRVIYYKRGWGRSLGVNAMHRVGSPDELRNLIDTPTHKLPDAAKPLASYNGRKR